MFKNTKHYYYKNEDNPGIRVNNEFNERIVDINTPLKASGNESVEQL